MRTTRFGVILSATIALHLQGTGMAVSASKDDIQKAYAELMAADHWRDAKAAAEALGAIGDAALPTIIQGSKHESSMVRQYSYEVLRTVFPTNEEAVAAIIAGLSDEDSMISYPCAFHLGQHRILKAKAALEGSMKDESRSTSTRYAVAKSLAELGDQQVMVMLYIGLGSEDHYTRYLSNIGMKALCQKDLTDFGYQGPWEGAFVSGPGVCRIQGQPLEKAKRKAERWQAIVRFLEWLEMNRPELFGRLDTIW